METGDTAKESLFEGGTIVAVFASRDWLSLSEGKDCDAGGAGGRFCSELLA
jgi:hypothetical protein